MKIFLRWQRVSTFGTKFIGRCEMFLPLKRINIKSSVFPTSTSIAPTTIRSSRSSALHRQLPVQPYAKERSGMEQVDLFSAQLVACRDQNWWNPESRVDCLSELSYTDASAGQIAHHDDTSSRRSLSMREIRRRMNSDQRSMRSTESSLSTPLEFEPGLKFLDGVRGGWKDMEMFID
jgi:hypothetical protein